MAKNKVKHERPAFIDFKEKAELTERGSTFNAAELKDTLYDLFESESEDRIESVENTKKDLYEIQGAEFEEDSFAEEEFDYDAESFQDAERSHFDEEKQLLDTAETKITEEKFQELLDNEMDENETLEITKEEPESKKNVRYLKKKKQNY